MRLFGGPAPVRMWGMGRVIAVANQKGGVAKTTTVASLGVALAELGRRVLLVDLDPQACLTFSLGLDPESLDLSVHDVLLGRVSASVAIATTEDGPRPPAVDHRPGRRRGDAAAAHRARVRAAQRLGRGRSTVTTTSCWTARRRWAC